MMRRAGRPRGEGSTGETRLVGRPRYTLASCTHVHIE